MKKERGGEKSESPHPGPLPSEWEREEELMDRERDVEGGFEDGGFGEGFLPFLFWV